MAADEKYKMLLGGAVNNLLLCAEIANNPMCSLYCTTTARKITDALGLAQEALKKIQNNP